jgi:dipeptidyl aminopeptidase/acylaminoacyl peptidase
MAGSNDASATRRPTPELLVDVRTPDEFAIGPDGEAVAFTLRATVADAGSIAPSDLWLREGSGSPRRLTSGAGNDHSPVWSPGGDRLAFISDRARAGQGLVYTLSLPGGEPEQVGVLDGSAESLLWSGSGDRLLVIAADPGSYGLDASARPVMGGPRAQDPAVLRPEQSWRRLFLIDAASGAVTEVGPAGHSVWEVDWDGERVVVAIVSGEAGVHGWYHSELARLDLGERAAKTLYRPPWPLEGLALSPDARHAAVGQGYASDPGLLSGSLLIADVESGGVVDPWPDLQTAGVAQWCDDESLWYSRVAGTQTACGRAWLDGRCEEAWTGPAYIGADVCRPACAVADDGRVVYTTHQAQGLAPEMARLAADGGSWIRLTGFNDDLVRGMVFPDLRELVWTAPDGLQIEGLLMTPRGAQGPLPMIVAVHGGPTWCWNRYFSDSEPNAVLLADAGYAVLMPNPRGSIGRNHAFAQAVIGRAGHEDLGDIMAGVDLCVAEGLADPGRLGICGLSYGGYMSCWAPTQTDRFAASVAMGVHTNWTSYRLTSDGYAFVETMMGGDWNDPDGPHNRESPVMHAHKCRTPTLILQGADDRCTPVGQAEEQFAALGAAGVEVEMVIYPREGHVLFERAHVLDALNRTQGWFDRHLRPGG